ncbi:hypothetical protein GEU84_012400 [Fertoebacter nigrum]|uniref:Uncharacterized protein n=1 Tax=Fertoeibacter niger TaxID=2656921 RepID=A0A8X8GY20_9RHOB|nr:hypothetical protein [Fertoeibacter niger]NUB45192.1 hypothetical protein [Fertoeibacter niger]
MDGQNHRAACGGEADQSFRLSPAWRNRMLIAAAVPMPGICPSFGQDIAAKGMAWIAMRGPV